MQLNQASETEVKSVSKKTAITQADIQRTVQPPPEYKPSVVKTETPVDIEKTVKVIPIARSNKTEKPVKAATAAQLKATPAKPAATLSDYQFEMLARIISAEAKGEPIEGQVAVGAVILNRIKSGKFPDTVSKNVLKPGEFEPVSNGHIWRNPVSSAYKAARLAINGWDPTYGALYFYNPAKSSSRWIWSRRTITRIGDHVFAA
jgi:N-acetylmuramoyl-L-alanine amidase